MEKKKGDLLGTSKTFQRGKTTIPSIVRKYLNIKDGDYISYFYVNKEFVMIGTLPDEVAEVYEKIGLIKKDPK